MIEIESMEDLDVALARLDKIWSARPGDADWEERCALADQVERYEDEHVHIPPPTPEEAAQFRSEQEGRA